jgi:hypothetical protein
MLADCRGTRLRKAHVKVPGRCAAATDGGLDALPRASGPRGTLDWQDRAGALVSEMTWLFLPYGDCQDSAWARAGLSRANWHTIFRRTTEFREVR